MKTASWPFEPPFPPQPYPHSLPTTLCVRLPYTPPGSSALASSAAIRALAEGLRAREARPPCTAVATTAFESIDCKCLIEVEGLLLGMAVVATILSETFSTGLCVVASVWVSVWSVGWQGTNK